MVRNAKELTKRQKELLSIMYDYIRTTGYPPTFEEMRETLGVSSNQSIIDLLERLEASGAIERREGARSLAILHFGYQILKKDRLVPFVGVSAAGPSIDPVEIAGEWQPVSNDVIQFAEQVFLLRIMGDSMINAGINESDVVLVQSKKEFYSGEIVLANTQAGVTVKRFISEDKPPYVYLKPENPNHDIILFTDDVELQGKVISVLKDGQWKSVK